MFVTYALVLAGLLTGEVHPALGSCNLSTQVELRGLCCDKCPPGTYRADWCDENTATRCQPCPQNTYNEEFNTYHTCQNTKRCVGGLRQVMIEDYTPTRDRRCGCQKNETFTPYAKGGTMFWCCPHCPAGTEARSECSFEDFITQCSTCPPGTFSDVSGAPCRNCSRCGNETSPCTNTSDAVCILIDPDGSTYVTAIIAGAVIGCVLIVVAAALWKILGRRRDYVAYTDRSPSPRGDSSSLKRSTSDSSPTVQHEQENDLENPLNRDTWGPVSISSIASSGIGSLTSESLLL